MNLKNKTLLVTGGTSGIGFETAVLASQHGANVIVCGRDKEKGVRAVKSASEQASKISFLECDISSVESIKQLFTHIENDYGAIDLAFNNAGITAKHASIHLSDINNWNEVININLIGTYLCMRYEINNMLKNNGGVILNTSSAAGIMAITGQSSYVASKMGIIGLTQSAAIDYASSHPQIRINAIAPGPILGGMNDDVNLQNNQLRTEKKIASTAMKRFGTAAEVASTVLWLLSSDSSYITGATIPVDGGYSAGKF